MPELPEVETIRRDLEPLILNKKLANIAVKEKVHLLKNCTASQLKQAIVGEKLNEIGRRGKFLLFHFGDYVMLLHLRMSGRLLTEESKHSRMIMQFSDETNVYFDDARRFGSLHLVEAADLEELPSIKRLGIEPFQDDYTFENFRERLQSTQEVKRWLLDQQKISGLGNIYVCEALHISKIHPLRLAISLSKAEAKKLFDAIPKVLEHAIYARGTSISTYASPNGELGNFQEDFKVYSREGDVCFGCGSEIRRIVQGGRSSFFCERCQPLN